MGICESKGNKNTKGSPQPGPFMNLGKEIPGYPMLPIKSEENVVKSICKIITPIKSGSGFFIKLFKREKYFYCLMTNEHLVTNAMIEEKKIGIYYDNAEKYWKFI